MQIEIISNINMDSLKFYMKGYKILTSCSFGNYMIDLVDTNSLLYKSSSEIVILFLDIDELEEDIDIILSHIDNFIKNTNKTIIINTVSFTPYYIDTFLNSSLEMELTTNQSILDFTKSNSSVLLLDFLKLTKQNNFYDEKYWYAGRIKFNKIGFETIANEIKLLIETYKYGSKKVLVLDLDNTLWGGIVGEEEIILSNDGIGKIYIDFQKKIKRLKDLGILLAICSKNNYEDGLKGLNHPNSILSENDFIIKKINWNDKASNIKEILIELNLGENSLVFIDDNPVEREFVNTMIPDLTIPNFPKNIYNLNSWFLEIVQDNFSKINITDEDKNKQKQYLAKIKRDISSKDISYDHFLTNLNIEITFHIDDERHIQRYSQMTQKTNQFNLTTKRYTISDISNFIKDDEYNVIAVSYKDKFANEGITGLVILHKINNCIEIDTFLLSCRILKRGVEKSIFEKLEELYSEFDLIGNYIPTKKNSQTEDLYITYGFEKTNNNQFIKRKKNERKNN